MRRALFVLPAVAVGLAQSCSSPTEVVVVVDGDAASLDTIAVVVEGAEGFRFSKTVSPAEVPLPLTLGVQAGGDENGVFTVTATGSRGGSVVVTKKARARFAAGESRVLTVALCRVCEGATCDEATTCGAAGACEPITEQASLPGWTGTPPANVCAAAPPSAANDGGDDGAVVADAGPVEVLPGGFHVVGDARNWSSVDLGVYGYVGAAFDGTYVYLAPFADGSTEHGKVARYDTRLAFGDKAASWSFFDVTTVAPNAKGFVGAAVIDVSTSYLYLSPYGDGSGDVVARYRIDQPFTDPASWSTFDLSSSAATSPAGGFGGAVVNYSHVWLPTRDPARPFALQDHRDGGANVIDAGWESVDPRAVASGDAGAAVPGGYFGSAFDLATQFFFAPYKGPSGPHGVALTRAIGGTAQTGWTRFDLASLSPDFKGFAGAVFDGNYVYFVPNVNAAGPHGHVLRVDATKPFAAAESWESIDLAVTVDPTLAGFVGGVFDGRFLLLVPNVGTVVARYDTAAPFGDAASWSRFDTKLVTGGAAISFSGGAYDGRFVYLVPTTHGPVLRFEARENADKTLLKAHGSFL